jgi:hypothetical protein
MDRSEHLVCADVRDQNRLVRAQQMGQLRVEVERDDDVSELIDLGACQDPERVAADRRQHRAAVSPGKLFQAAGDDAESILEVGLAGRLSHPGFEAVNQL